MTASENPPGQKTILYVDDEELLRKALRRWLSRHFGVVLAENGKEALDLITALNINRTEEETRAKIDAVVSDFEMPIMNGFELAQRLREIAPGLPIIITTGNPGTLQEDAASKGVTLPPMLAKPYDRAKLLELLGQALGGKPQQDA
jgi:CheY-like chemotaxis protein